MARFSMGETKVCCFDTTLATRRRDSKSVAATRRYVHNILPNHDVRAAEDLTSDQAALLNTVCFQMASSRSLTE